MSKIKIVTDSTADLPLDLIKQYDITIVPLAVNFGNISYLEGTELSPKDFYAKLSASETLPTTSQPSPGDFAAVFKELAQNGNEEIISIHLSSKLSGTYQSALLGKSMVADLIKINVFDSQVVTMGLGLIVIAAARAAQEGKNIEEISKIITDLQSKMNIFFVVDTLEYLQKGGRIGKASSIMGALLNIKPILTLADGEVHPYEKVRGKGKALERLIDIANANIASESKIQCAIVHSSSLDSALKLHEKVLAQFNCTEIFISDIGAVVGTHVGPGTIAFIFYTL
ncbi:MAG: hypothetical protein JM58_03835 [Peptococcaceae bacterium BICA1-8]|nr:MAG: hypothetical protein JM58_03835 [Peptococcaceae bacterium BICA1-8]